MSAAQSPVGCAHDSDATHSDQGSSFVSWVVWGCLGIGAAASFSSVKEDSLPSAAYRRMHGLDGLT